MERASSPSSFDNPDPSAARWAGMFSRLQRLGFDSHLRLHSNREDCWRLCVSELASTDIICELAFSETLGKNP
jgi:hypothetical protein